MDNECKMQNDFFAPHPTGVIHIRTVGDAGPYMAERTSGYIVGAIIGRPFSPHPALWATFLLRCPTSACVGGAPWHLSTAATRSASFTCLWQRSPRSPVAVPGICLRRRCSLAFADRCHSLRQSASYNAPFSASGKFRLYLGFSSPHKAGFAGSPVYPPPAALPSLPPGEGFSGGILCRPSEEE